MRLIYCFHNNSGKDAQVYSNIAKSLDTQIKHKIEALLKFYLKSEDFLMGSNNLIFSVEYGFWSMQFPNKNKSMKVFMTVTNDALTMHM